MTSLRSKILYILALLLCAVGAISFGVSSSLLDHSLTEFEKRAVSDQFKRVELAFNQDVDALVRNVVSRAVWDDAALHVRKRDETYMDKNFTTVSLENLQAHAAAFFTLKGELHSSVDIRSGQRRELKADDPVTQAMRSVQVDPARQTGGNAKRWINGKPVLLVFSAVRSDQPWAANVGWLVIARGLEDDNLRDLVRTTGAHFRIVSADLSRSTSSGLPSSTITEVFSDSLGSSDLRLEVDLPQDLGNQRKIGIWLLLANALVLVVLAIVAAVLLLDRLILKRLGLFARKALVHQDGNTDNLQAWPVQGHDELDQLAMALNTMVTNVGHARNKLEHDVRTDALTGLGNRKLLYEQLDYLMGQQRRNANITLALLLIDLDDFKIINDSLGHEAGNFLLVEIADALKKLVRAADVVTRLGGDEFALIYVSAEDQLGVQQFVTRVQDTIARPWTYKDAVLTVTGSIGVAYVTGSLDKDALLRNADLAMYSAKKAGKGGHSFFNDPMLGNVQDRMLMEQRLRECLHLDQLEVWFQPIVDVRSGEVFMFEALARWPLDGGYCPPDRFIPVAEESGLITPLGMAIARKVIAAMPSLLALDARNVVNINLSPKQLLSKGLVEQMTTLLDEAHVPRSCIHFELTESALASDADHAKEQLEALSKAGFHLHLDDFGTGYSSLHRLQSLPFSTLKLDRSFVVLMSKGDDRIAKVIISLASQMNMEVIAEGIETADQQAQLMALNCHMIQGYLHAKPMPLHKLLQWLSERPAPLPHPDAPPALEPTAH
jgi:diguanylate cyclase (GGDEF)-like protein